MLPQDKTWDHCPSVGPIMVGASRLKGRVRGDSRYVPKNIDLITTEWNSEKYGMMGGLV